MFLFVCVYKCADSKRDGNNLHKRSNNSRRLIGLYPIRAVRTKRERKNPKPARADRHPLYTVCKYKAIYRFENMSYNMSLGHVLQH